MKAPKTLASTLSSCLKPSSAASAAARASVVHTIFKLSGSGDSSALLPEDDLCSILNSATGSRHRETNDAESLSEQKKKLDMAWLPTAQRREPREKKSRFREAGKQVRRFDKIVDLCASTLGTETTLQIFNKLEAGVKECNALIKSCIEEARDATDEVNAEKHMQLAIRVFESMKEQGFPLEEETYGPLLRYLIDMGLTKEFCLLCGVIKSGNPSSISRLGYYEMKLWIRVDHEENIQELCNDIESYDGADKSLLRENYLLALCESNQRKEIVQLLESVELTEFSSPNTVEHIFTCLGRLQLESFAEKVLLEFKKCAGNTSILIYSYVVGIQNLAVEDVISKFRTFHTKLEEAPLPVSFEKLIVHCCNSLQVHAALELVDEMFELGLRFSSSEALHSLLQASIENCDYNLVHRIYSVIKRGNLKPNSEIFRSMIYLYVRMKDYEGAYSLLHDLNKLGEAPTVPMYNTIMVGYFREKKLSRGRKVLDEIKVAGLKPDSQTFSHLIQNCNSEEDIKMYYEEMKEAGIQTTKHVFMALINAYTTCGQIEKAKQVLLDKGIPQDSINEIRSVLVQALASHGQLSNAYNIYEKIKEAGCSLEPKAVISLIEHLQSDDVALSRLLHLLETLKDPKYWLDGCTRTILYCVRYKYLRTVVNLLEQIRDQVRVDELVLEVIFDKVFAFIAESDSSLQFGLDLLHAMKHELGLIPSRKCLDFLLHACVSAEDLQSSLFVWQEYQAAGLPYNTFSFLRMYQALLAAGDRKAAKIVEHKIPKSDLHVRLIIEACKLAYSKKQEKNKNMSNFR